MLRFLRLLAIFFLFSTHLYAYTDKDQSTLKTNLNKQWKVSESNNQADIVSMTGYMRNAATDETEVLVESKLTKAFPDTNAKLFMKNLYDSATKLLSKNKCTYSNLGGLPKNEGMAFQWAITWACEESKSSGFMYFGIGDAKTMYSITYKKANAYPLTAARKTQMLSLLKAMQVCYEGNVCYPLY